MRVAVVALIVCSLALAGCTTSEPATALQLRGDAESAAEAMDPSSTLVGIFGPEWSSETFAEKFRSESPEAAQLDQGVDTNLGDGYANAWGFLFETDGEPILILIASDGNILHEERVPGDSNTSSSYGDGAPLGEVAVDSDEAATIVRENSAKYMAILEKEDAVAVMALGHDNDQDAPFWVFTAFSESEEDFAFAIVNAADGSYMDFPWFG